VVVFTICPFTYKYNVAEAVVVPDMVVVAGVNIPLAGAVITGIATDPAKALGPFPAAQK
jgi:hypothetical protein